MADPAEVQTDPGAVPPVGLSPQPVTAPPSTEPPAPSFTQADVDKARSDALATAGREKATMDARKADLDTQAKRNEEVRLQNERDSETAATTRFEGNMEGMAAWRRDQNARRAAHQLAEDTARVAADKAANEARGNELAAVERNGLVNKIAGEHKLDAAQTELLRKNGDATPEGLNELALGIAKGSSSALGEAPVKPDPSVPAAGADGRVTTAVGSSHAKMRDGFAERDSSGDRSKTVY